MNIFGKKVILRAIEKEDLEFLRDLHNGPEIEKWIGGWSFPLSMSDQEAWFEKISRDKSSIRMIIELKDSHEIIGFTGLWDIDWKDRRAYTGIILVNDEKYRKKGYATDVVMALMNYTFRELGLNRLDSDIVEYNNASLKLYLERCGWKNEGVRRKHTFRNGNFYDRVMIGILRGEYEELLKETRYWE
jgi:RimJ/RimL family protein N-acetyltransferase